MPLESRFSHQFPQELQDAAVIDNVLLQKRADDGVLGKRGDSFRRNLLREEFTPATIKCREVNSHAHSGR
jgi:hypothetical protein